MLCTTTKSACGLSPVIIWLTFTPIPSILPFSSGVYKAHISFSTPVEEVSIEEVIWSAVVKNALANCTGKV